MVGFKTIWPALFLLAITACVPQTKQTQCATNEAFNASLRTCVPIVGGPSSFVKVDSYIPTTALTKYAASTTPIEFSITVDNPYAQTYDVEWIRSYNGSPFPIGTVTDLEVSISPSNLVNGSVPEYGTHVITAKIKVKDVVVDTHNFELIITNNPTPQINDSLNNPLDYSTVMFPDDGLFTFSLEVDNNNSTDLATGNYSTVWSLTRNGQTVPLFCLQDDFTDTNAIGTNTADCGFDPLDAAIALMGGPLGSYVLRARITRTAAPVVIVDEQVWSITVQHPNLSKVTARGFYDGVGGDPILSDNGYAVAYNNISYTTVGPAPATAYNFVPCSGLDPDTCSPVVNANQAEFCVTVASGEGSYAGDSQYVRVAWYLDGVTLLHSELTSIADNRVCLSDGGSTILSSVLFANSSNTATQTRTIIARVWDERTTLEYTSSDMLSTIGYPIKWNIAVRPENSAPVVTHGAVADVDAAADITCANANGTVRTCSQVFSDNTFSLTTAMNPTTGDDFYDLPSPAGTFSHECRLYENSVLISTVAGTYNGTTGFVCNMRIPSYNTAGVVPVHARAYQIQSVVTDNGSPLTTTPATSAVLTWNFAVGAVKEYNTAPSLSFWSTDSNISELTTFGFEARIVDNQHDAFIYQVEYCNNAACTNWVNLAGASGSVTNSSGVDVYDAITHTYILNSSIVLPEDFLMGLTGVDCDPLTVGTQGGNTLLESEPCNVGFRIKVTEVPSNSGPTPVPVPTVIPVYPLTYTATLRNHNPRPVFNSGATSPNPAAYSNDVAWGFVGVPLFILNNPTSTISDLTTSTVVSERTLRYQWYARNALTSPTWTAIPNATSASLAWSPSYMLDTLANNVELMLCLTDYPVAAVTTPNPTGPGEAVCNDTNPWEVVVRNNLVEAADLASGMALSTASIQQGTEMATWTEGPRTLGSITSTAVYTAMVGNDLRIHVKKVLVKTNGEIDPLTTTDIISFNAVSSGTTYDVKNLSMTGITGHSLYIAYAVSNTGSPTGYYPAVRRINIGQNASKTLPNKHLGTLGFDYDGLSFTGSTCTLNCTLTPINTLGNIVTFDGNTVAGETIVLNSPAGNFTVTFAVSPNGTTQICENCTPATAAQALADLINRSTDPLLAGYSAVSSGGTVRIYGGERNDYYDEPAISAQVGKIYIHNNTWYLPYIRQVLPGHNLKIALVSGPANASSVVDGRINLTATSLNASTSIPLAAMQPATQFDNYYYYDVSAGSGKVAVSLVTSTGSSAYLYVVEPDNWAATASKQIFTSDIAVRTQVAFAEGYSYVGLHSSASKFRLGVYSSILNTEREEDINLVSLVESNSDTEDYFNFDDVASYRLVAYDTQARIIATSKGTSAAPNNYRLYMARIFKFGSLWYVSCGNCAEIGTQSLTVSPYVSIGVSTPNISSGASYQLGYSGTQVGQGVRDTISIAFAQMDNAAAPTKSEPWVGLFNIQGEGVDATALPATDNGMWRPPFIRN